MADLPEQQARQTIDAMLVAAGWAVQDDKAFDPSAFISIALRKVALVWNKTQVSLPGLARQTSIVADLNAEALDVQEAESSQGGALQGQGGATASLPGLLKQGADMVKCLDAVIKNRFRNDPATLGAWKIASRVMSTGGGGEEEPPAPPTPPPAG